ncbi:kinase [Spongisporangium articulatum]|uniref:Kinase n=1 Tax=Spongisporangium articulatum TaxID=3362603 RepID=A0ABW8AIQ8_9ACTN
MSLGVILYGPPASGKSTIGRLLAEQVEPCRLFRRIKVGGIAKPEYRAMTPDQLEDLERAGDIVWSNDRYGATYAIDRPELMAELGNGVPVLALGQVAAVWAVAQSVPSARWLTVELWCPRDEAKRRLLARDPQDVERRLAVWDATEHLPQSDLVIDTRTTALAEVVELIRTRLIAGAGNAKLRTSSGS